MLRKLGAVIHRGLFWTYDRGTWQYDVMVALILAFIFLTPRSWFGDRPVSTPPAPSEEIVLLLHEPTQQLYQIPTTLMELDAEGSLDRSAERVLETHTGKSMQVIRIEPGPTDSLGKVVSYAVWVREQADF